MCAFLDRMCVPFARTFSPHTLVIYGESSSVSFYALAIFEKDELVVLRWSNKFLAETPFVDWRLLVVFSFAFPTPSPPPFS